MTTDTDTNPPARRPRVAYRAVDYAGREHVEAPTVRRIEYFVVGEMWKLDGTLAGTAYGTSGNMRAAKGMASDFRRRGYFRVEILPAVPVTDEH